MAVLIGDTVKLTVEFRTFGGALVDPEHVTFRTYDAKGEQFGEIAEGVAITRQSAGIYTHEYIVPHAKSPIIYEFVGTVNGKPILGRGKLYTTFVKE